MIKQDPELQQMLKAPYLNSSDMRKLLRKYKLARNPETKQRLRDEIFNNNIRFIRKIVSRRVGVSSDKFEDVFNAAVVSFFEGLNAYKLSEKSEKYSFTTYIYHWIMRAVYNEYVSDNIVFVPREHFFKKTDEQVHSVRNSNLVYLDMHIRGRNEGNTDKIEDIVPDPKTIFQEDESIERLSLDQIKSAMEICLNTREKAVIFLRYTFDESLNLHEIAKFLKLQSERVRYLESLALYKIRYYLQNGKKKVMMDRMGQVFKEIEYEDIKDFYKNAIELRRLKQENFVKKA